MKEFFGFGGYQRVAEGFFSFEHIAFVSALMLIMTAVAVWLGLRNTEKSFLEKARVLKVSAILIDSFELFKIVIFCVRGNDPWAWLYELPLFLCSIQLITIPLAAFSKGRLQEASLDFVAIFGILGALSGTYGAGNIYSCYPVLSFDTVVSGITHAISGFCGLYILIAKMAGMKKKNMWITFAVLFGFCTAAYTANQLLDYNYMFLTRGDGTPYDILYNLVGGSALWYPLGVVALFVLYIVAYHGVFYAVTRKKADARNSEQQKKQTEYASR